MTVTELWSLISVLTVRVIFVRLAWGLVYSKIITGS